MNSLVYLSLLIYPSPLILKQVEAKFVRVQCMLNTRIPEENDSQEDEKIRENYVNSEDIKVNVRRKSEEDLFEEA